MKTDLLKELLAKKRHAQKTPQHAATDLPNAPRSQVTTRKPSKKSAGRGR